MITKTISKYQIEIVDGSRSYDKLVKIRGRSLRIQRVSHENLNYYNANLRDKNNDFIRGLKSGSVYVLRNLNGGVYVGETSDFLKRRKNDKPIVKDWVSALVISDYIEDFGDFDATTRGYVEDRLWEESCKAGNYKDLNGRRPGHDKNISLKDKEWAENDVIPLVRLVAKELGWNKLFTELEDLVRDEVVEESNAEDECLRHIIDWTEDDKKYSPGPTKRWVGHRFISKVLGKLDDTTIEISHNIASFIYLKVDSRGIVNINDEFIREMIDLCGISWVKKKHILSDRENIIRGYVNLLDKMGVIKRINGKRSWEKARFTERGEKFAHSTSLAEKKSFLSIAIDQWKWPHECGINPRQFARGVENILGRKQTQLEWELFGSHGGVFRYKYTTEEDISYLINKFNSLPEEVKRHLGDKARKFIDQSDDNPGSSSLSNWNKNVEYNYEYIVVNSDLSDGAKKLLKECKNDVSDVNTIYDYIEGINKGKGVCGYGKILRSRCKRL